MQNNSLQDLFDGFNDPARVNEVTGRIMEQMENPQFIFFLFQSLTQQLYQENTSLYVLIQITISNNIRTKWRTLFDENAPVFWAPELRTQIALNLLEGSFSIPNQQRSHFINALKIIIELSFLKSGFIIQHLLELYNKNSSDIVCTNTYLKIAVLYSKTCSLRINSENISSDENILEELEAYDSQILNSVFSIIPNCTALITENQDACVIIFNAIKVLRFASSHISKIFSNQQFQQVLTQIIPMLAINTDNDSVLNVKVQVCKLIDKLNSTYLLLQRKKQKLKKTILRDQANREHYELLLQFDQTYREQYVPLIIQNIIQLLQMQLNFQLNKLIVNIFYEFLFYDAYNENIFTPEFLIGVLLKFARVDPDDFNEPEINPYAYVNTYMKIDLIDAYRTTRAYCAMIIEMAIDRLNLIDQLYPFFFSQSSDVFELEAKLFLLTKYLKSVKAKEKSLLGKKKNRKKAGPIQPHIKIEDFNVILEQLKNQNPPFLQITLMQICKFVLKHLNPLLGIQISEQVILGSELPIFIYYGAKMFNTCFDSIPSEQKPETSNIPQLINKLIPIGAIFKDEASPKMVQLLCTINTDNLTSYGPSLIGVLFKLAYENFKNGNPEDSSRSCDVVLDNIFDIIAKFEDDSPLLSGILVTSVNCSKEFLIEDDFESAYKIYEILALLNQKISPTNPIQIEVLGFLISHWDHIIQLYPSQDPSESIVVINSKEICQIIYPLMTGVDKTLANFPDLMQQVFKLTDLMVEKSIAALNSLFSKKQMKEYGDRMLSAGYSLFLASCIIQVFNEVNTSYLEAAISLINPIRLKYIRKGDTLITITGALFVVGACLVVNPSTTSAYLNPQMIEAISKIISHKLFTTYRDMVLAFILLMNFVKLGYQPAFEIAAKNLKYLIKYKKAEEEGEEYDEEEEEEEEAEEEESNDNQKVNNNDEYDDDDDDDDDIAKIIAPFRVPFDDYDAINLFKEVSNQSGLFNSLSPDLQQEVIGLIT
ncbi:hypothetical protein M9Y10_043880 [Tritrichomonas musculus]|uniref:Importin N-terminal domain-containing protein n=1 Tax=Tritrichomonas musculus TaxID=1915356 RepID=A0ABR2K0W4_9EUKA